MTQPSNPPDSEDEITRRVPGSRLKLWLLLSANRWLVTGVLLGVAFCVFVVLGVLDPSPLRQAVANKDPIETAFQALLTAIITGVTLVVTINQLVLSQELGTVGDQRDRMEGAMQFRRDAESSLGIDVSPVTPAAFLQSIVEGSAAAADRLRETVTDVSDDDVRQQIESYTDEIRENATSVSDSLDGAQFGTFDVIDAALDFNYSEKIHQARRLRQAEPIGDETREALDELVEILERFAPAREHFKTLYFQWELINLSRAVLYAAVPALLVTTGMILYVDNSGTVVGTTLGVDNLIWLVSAATTVALLPFVLLLTYILRITTVAKRTLAIGPFVLRRTDDSTGFEPE